MGSLADTGRRIAEEATRKEVLKRCIAIRDNKPQYDQLKLVRPKAWEVVSRACRELDKFSTEELIQAYDLVKYGVIGNTPSMPIVSGDPTAEDRVWEGIDKELQKISLFRL